MTYMDNIQNVSKGKFSYLVSPFKALQKQLACRVRIERPYRPLRFIAGLDAAFSRHDNNVCIGAAVLWDVKEKDIITGSISICPSIFDYVPGLLALREGEVLLNAIKILNQHPDCIIVDGHGIAHPRRFGIASHLGILTGIPSIGCAKNRLIGEFNIPSASRGSFSFLTEKGEILGAVVRTRKDVKPLFVSIGHKIDLDTAIGLVLNSVNRFRLPEPIRAAHRLSTTARNLMDHLLIDNRLPDDLPWVLPNALKRMLPEIPTIKYRTCLHDGPQERPYNGY